MIGSQTSPTTNPAVLHPPLRPKMVTRLYISLIVGTLCALFAATLLADRTDVGTERIDRTAIAIFMVTATLAALFPLHLTHQTKAYVDTAVFTAMVVKLGVPEAIGVAALSVAVAQVLLRDHRSQMMFNAAQTGVYVGAGCLTFHILARVLSIGLGPAIIAAALVMYGINTLLVSTVGALESDADPMRVWRADLLLDLPEHVALVILGVVIATIMDRSPFALPLVAAPLVLVYGSLRRSHRAQSLARADVEALASLVDQRTEDTRGHSERVAHLVSLIGEQLGLAANEVSRMARAARVHDVGKVHFAPAVPGCEDDQDETAADRRGDHAIVGAELISTVPAYAPCVPDVRHHHERWDGTGDPDGLAGTLIPLGARIIALTNAFDHLTSPAVAGVRTSEARALAELRRGAGTLWDPGLVQALALTIEGVRPAAVGARDLEPAWIAGPPSLIGSPEQHDA